MATGKGISWAGFTLRLLVAVILVFASYNPEGASYYHWVKNDFPHFTPLMALAGIILLIGWTIYLRATARSLGAFGLLLATAFFGALLWLVIDLEWVPTGSIKAISYIVLVMVCGVLATGISWSHIRRRITGQIDVDDVEGDAS